MRFVIGIICDRKDKTKKVFTQISLQVENIFQISRLYLEKMNITQLYLFIDKVLLKPYQNYLPFNFFHSS
jgi:Ethanolamine utilization protein EutJ (predicted chaperonin)